MKTKVFIRLVQLDAPTEATWSNGPHADVAWEAIAEDGTVVRSGLASSRDWARFDSGLLVGGRRGQYVHRYPDGYELIEAPGPDPEAWAAVQAAVLLRQERAA